MKRICGTGLVGLVGLAFAIVLWGVAWSGQAMRLQGTIRSLHRDAMLIQSRPGKAIDRIVLDRDTRIAALVRSSFSFVQKGSRVAIVTAGAGSPVAREVVIFPPTAEGTGKGRYSWAMLLPSMPGMIEGRVSGRSGGTMANIMPGTAASAAGAAGRPADGVITLAGAGAGPARIMVPPNVPILALRPAPRATLKQGSAVIIGGTKIGGKLIARFIATGRTGISLLM